VSHMNIAFIRKQLDGRYYITSPQLTGWICSGRTRDAAEAAIAGSLWVYVKRRPGLSPMFRAEILKLADDWRSRGI
jgi:hypothetical protein